MNVNGISSIREAAAAAADVAGKIGTPSTADDVKQAVTELVNKFGDSSTGKLRDIAAALEERLKDANPASIDVRPGETLAAIAQDFANQVTA